MLGVKHGRLESSTALLGLPERIGAVASAVAHPCGLACMRMQVTTGRSSSAQLCPQFLIKPPWRMKQTPNGFTPTWNIKQDHVLRDVPELVDHALVVHMGRVGSARRVCKRGGGQELRMSGLDAWQKPSY